MARYFKNDLRLRLGFWAFDGLGMFLSDFNFFVVGFDGPELFFFSLRPNLQGS